MEKWMFLLLVIFLVPRCQCNKSNVNRTGILFDEIDRLLAQITEGHHSFYADKGKCFESLDFVEEQYRTEHYGIAVLQDILKRYNNLTQLYNSGCKKQISGNSSGEDITCGPFGCHKVDISFLPEKPNKRGLTFNTNINGSNNNMNVWLATKPPTTTTLLPTPHSLTTQKPPITPKPSTKPRQTTAEPSREDLHRLCMEEGRKWLPLPFHPWGHCSTIHPVNVPPKKGV